MDLGMLGLIAAIVVFVALLIATYVYMQRDTERRMKHIASQLVELQRCSRAEAEHAVLRGIMRAFDEDDNGEDMGA